MKRLFLVLAFVVSILAGTSVSAQSSIEFGYGKQIYRSYNGLGFIEELKDMKYNGGYLAFKHLMPFSKSPNSLLAVQIGVKYDFQIGKSTSVQATHKEHYLELPVLLHLFVRNQSSMPVCYLFAGPAFDVNLSTKLKKEFPNDKSSGKTGFPHIYGYTNIDVKACVGFAFSLTDYVDIRATYNFGLSNRRGMIDNAYHTPTSKLFRLNSDILNIGFVYYL